MTKISKVLILSTRIDIRNALRDAFKKLDISTSIATEYKEALGMMKEEDFSWVISEISSDKKHSPFSLFHQNIMNTEKKPCLISLYASEEQLKALPIFFELGLFTYHLMPFTSSQIAIEIGNIVKEIEENKNFKVEISTKYLRQVFEKIGSEDRMMEVERKLAQVFKKDPQYLLQLAESYLMKENPDEALKLLESIKYVEGDANFAVKQLKELILSTYPDMNVDESKSFAEANNIKGIAVVDPDSTTSTQIKTIAEKMGISQIEVFESGKDALEFVGKGECQILFTEWKIKDLTGLQLVRRVVGDNKPYIPIIVVSSQLQESDKLLLQEFGVSEILPKPLNANEMVQSMVNIFQITTDSKANKALESKMQNAFVRNDKDALLELLNEYKGCKQPSSSKIEFHSAQYCYLSEDYSQARVHLINAIKSEGETIHILDLLGKVLMKSRRFQEAQLCFQKAQKVSPNNINRLCEMASISIEENDFEKSHEQLLVASNIDSGNQNVLETKSNLALSNGNVDELKDLAKNEDVVKSMVAFMNNKAVFNVSEGKIEEALELYKNAASAIPAQHHEIVDKIYYNMGLAHLRLQNNAEAKAALSKMSGKDPKMTAKRDHLMGSIEKSLKAGVPLKFDKPVKKGEEEKGDVFRPVGLHLNPGEHCLHLIFEAQDEDFESAKQVLGMAS